MSSLKTIVKNKSYLSVAFIFVSLNVLIGTWAIYIPTIKSNLGISEGRLGFALFFFAAGTFVVLALANKLITKLGAGKACFFGLMLHCGCFILPFLATDFVQLCIGLFLSGLTSAFTDIAMNSLIADYEKRDKVMIMSSAHGFFSLGGMIGAGLGIPLMGYFDNPLHHMICVVIGLVIVNIITMRHYYKDKAVSEEGDGKFSVKLFKPLFALGLIAFIVMSAEGAITDWSALYLEQVCLAGASMVGLGYAFFSIFMTIGRFWGDAISSRFGSLQIICYGALLAMIAFLVTLTGNLILSLIGFSVVGLGLSVIIPELFRLAGQSKGTSSTQGIAFVAGIGYAGFLSGPVILGGLAGTFGLKASFIFLCVILGFAFLFSLTLRK